MTVLTSNDLITVSISGSEYIAASIMATWEAYGQYRAFEAPLVSSLGATSTGMFTDACQRRIDEFLRIADDIRKGGAK